MAELEPCPFCGLRMVFERTTDGEDFYEHRHNDCILARVGLGDPFVVFNDPECIAAWNRRAPSPAPVADDPIRQLGQEMLRITTTVVGLSLEDACAVIPELWLHCMRERDELRDELRAARAAVAGQGEAREALIATLQRQVMIGRNRWYANLQPSNVIEVTFDDAEAIIAALAAVERAEPSPMAAEYERWIRFHATGGGFDDFLKSEGYPK